MLKVVSREEAQKILNKEFKDFSFNDFILHWTDFEDTSLIVNLCKDYERILEIGTHLGYTCENLSRYTKGHITTVDITKNILKETEFQNHEILDAKDSGKMVDMSRANVTKIHMKSDDFFEQDLTGRFDCIFIDGDHSYEQVRKDSLNAFASMLSGIIVWHDVYNLDDNWDYKRLAEPNNDGVVRVLKELPIQAYKIDRSWVAFALV